MKKIVAAPTYYIFGFSSAFIKFAVVQYIIYLKKIQRNEFHMYVLCLSHNIAYDFSNKASKYS